MAFLKLTKLGLFLMLLGIIFQRRVVDTVKDLPPSDSRLNRGQTRFSSATTVKYMRRYIRKTDISPIYNGEVHASAYKEDYLADVQRRGTCV